jgi:hypothetical protein
MLSMCMLVYDYYKVRLFYAFTLALALFSLAHIHIHPIADLIDLTGNTAHSHEYND